MQRKRHAIHILVRQLEGARRHVQHRPCAGHRQVAGPEMAGAARRGALGDEVFTPERTVLPAVAGVPLQHQRLGRVVRVQADPGKHRLVGIDVKRRRCTVEVVFVQPLGQAAAVSTTGRRAAPGPEAFTLQRQRVLAVALHHMLLPIQRMGQQRGLVAQALAPAQGAGTLQQKTIQRDLEVGVDHVLVQQPGLP